MSFLATDFFDRARYQDLDVFEAALWENYQINGQTAHAALSKARRHRVIIPDGGTILPSVQG